MPRRIHRRIATALASVAVCAVLPASASAGVVTEFSSALTAGDAPADITTGPDGNLWFTERGVSRASAGSPPRDHHRVPAGLTPGFSLLVTPGEIVKGSDDGLWFTETGAVDAIARIDQFGSAVTEHVIGNGTNPQAITGGPDGAQDSADARGDDQGGPGVGVLTLGQSTPAGATERIHSRRTESPTRA